MLRLSSNVTLVLKVFIPTLWTSIFGLFGIALLLADSENLGILSEPAYKLGYFVFFILFFLFLYFTLLQLLRVEYGSGFIYVSNYFKTIKVGIGNVKKISEINLILFTLVIIHLKQKGRFGTRIPFIAKKSNYNHFVAEHADFFASLEH